MSNFDTHVKLSELFISFGSYDDSEMVFVEKKTKKPSFSFDFMKRLKNLVAIF